MRTEQLSPTQIQDLLLATLSRPVRRAPLNPDTQERWHHKLGLDKTSAKDPLQPWMILALVTGSGCVMLGVLLPMYFLDYMSSAKSFFAGLGLSLGSAFAMYHLAQWSMGGLLRWFMGMGWLLPDDIMTLDHLGANEPQITAPMGAWLQVPRTKAEGERVKTLIDALIQARERVCVIPPTPQERWTAHIRSHAQSTTAAYERTLLREATGEPAEGAPRERV